MLILCLRTSNLHSNIPLFVNELEQYYLEQYYLVNQYFAMLILCLRRSSLYSPIYPYLEIFFQSSMVRLLTEAVLPGLSKASDCPAFDLRIKWSVTQLYAQDLTERKDRVEIKIHHSVRETFTEGVSIPCPLLFQHTFITP